MLNLARPLILNHYFSYCR